MAGEPELIKVRLTDRGEDSETPWAHDLGPAPGPPGSRKVRLANVPFMHAKPTWGDVIIVTPVEDDFPVWDRGGVPWDQIATRIAEDGGRWAMIVDYAAHPGSEDAFRALAQACAEIEIVCEGAWGPREDKPGRAYLAVKHEVDDAAVMKRLRGANLPCELIQIHPEPAEKPVVMKPMATPVVAKPVATKPVATKPAATKPVATKPVATKPVATKPVATKPVATKPVATPVATKPAATKPAATKPTATKPAATKPAATKPAATKPAATKPAATIKSTASKPAAKAFVSKAGSKTAAKAASPKVFASKPGVRATASKSTTSTPTDKKPAAKKTAAAKAKSSRPPAKRATSKPTRQR
jgi:hypothetical protein